MRPGEGVPWTPQPLDHMLDESFERMTSQHGEIVLRRLDEMREHLEQLEHELDEILQQNAPCH